MPSSLSTALLPIVAALGALVPASAEAAPLQIATPLASAPSQAGVATGNGAAAWVSVSGGKATIGTARGGAAATAATLATDDPVGSIEVEVGTDRSRKPVAIVGDTVGDDEQRFRLVRLDRSQSVRTLRVNERVNGLAIDAGRLYATLNASVSGAGSFTELRRASLSGSRVRLSRKRSRLSLRGEVFYRPLADRGLVAASASGITEGSIIRGRVYAGHQGGGGWRKVGSFHSSDNQAVTVKPIGFSRDGRNAITLTTTTDGAFRIQRVNLTNLERATLRSQTGPMLAYDAAWNGERNTALLSIISDPRAADEPAPDRDAKAWPVAIGWG